jgi:hypothetical protein
MSGAITQLLQRVKHHFQLEPAACHPSPALYQAIYQLCQAIVDSPEYAFIRLAEPFARQYINRMPPTCAAFPMSVAKFRHVTILILKRLTTSTTPEAQDVIPDFVHAAHDLLDTLT